MGHPVTITNSEAEDITELRDAIIELYLAIKIRSTEEVSITYIQSEGNSN